MANTNLKFIKINTVPTTGLTVGAIYFETSTHLLKVAISATATEVYSGVQNVAYNEANKILTFTMPDGTSKVVNFGALNNKAENTITITGTDGLSGGGDLTENRTISHAVPTGATTKASGLYKIATDKFGHVTSAVAVAKKDITDLDIPGQDTNTTYQFTGGTNKFTVTPSEGDAVDVNITPSIDNNVVKSSAATTVGHLPKFVDANGTIANGYSVQSELSSSATAIPTGEAVSAAIDSKIAAADAMIFKGTIGTSGTATTVPTSNYKTGWTYKVITAGTYAGIKCEIGDMLIALKDGPASGSSVINADWTVVQTNIDGAVTGPASSTANHIVTFNDATGKVIKDSGLTISKSVPADAVFTDTHVTAVDNHYIPSTEGASKATETAGTNVTYGGKVITAVNKDAAGHVVGVTTGNIPSAPTISSLGGVSTVNATGTAPLTLNAEKTGTTINITGNVSTMGAASAATSGTSGLVPVPAAGKQSSFLRGDGTWATPTDTTYTFTNGTDGSFSVSASGGTDKKVSIGKPATAGTADEVSNAFSIQLGSSVAQTYNGSSAVSVQVTPKAIGAVKSVAIQSDTLNVSESHDTENSSTLTVNLYWEQF